MKFINTNSCGKCRIEWNFWERVFYWNRPTSIRWFTQSGKFPREIIELSYGKKAVEYHNTSLTHGFNVESLIETKWQNPKTGKTLFTMFWRNGLIDKWLMQYRVGIINGKVGRPGSPDGPEYWDSED